MSLSLNCLIHDEVQEKMFTVKISKTENVSILKDLIKEKKAPHLNHVAASDLDLWKVDLRLDDLGAEPVHVILDTYLKLSARRKLSSFFNDIVDDERLHIIAKAPGTSLHSFLGIAPDTSRK
jgi:Crinkler effector protein N-terminal domain